jgi:hypothetical protein
MVAFYIMIVCSSSHYPRTLHWPTDPCGVHGHSVDSTDFPWSLPGILKDSQGTFKEPTRSPQGVHKESVELIRSLQGAHQESTRSLWSSQGVHGVWKDFSLKLSMEPVRSPGQIFWRHPCTLRGESARIYSSGGTCLYFI